MPPPGPPPPPPNWELVTNNILGAKLLNCLLNDAENPAPIPLIAIKRALSPLPSKLSG